MEGILRSQEISEMIPFDYDRNIIYFPVRHHSPGCSWHLLQVMENYKPDCILVEGPETANKLIPVLTDEGTVPPAAFYYFYKDSTKYIDDSAGDYKCYYPFLRTSPEYNALRYACISGIYSAFIDLPYGDILINTAKEKGLRRKSDISSYGDEYYFSESRYFSELCSKTGMRSFEEFWEKYFETDALHISTEEFIKRMYTYCIISRKNTPESEMLSDGCLVRESFMAKNIIKASEQFERVLVVTGGFHSYGLYQLVEGITKPQKFRQHNFSQKVQDVYAMCYSFEAADALNGYSSGMQNPGFYDKVWSGIIEAKENGISPENVYEDAVLDTLLKCAKACVKEKLLITMSDISSAVTMYTGLAAVRDKHSPGLYELYDSVRTCFIKGEVNASTDLPLRILNRTAAGSEIGKLSDNAEKVPIIRDFEELTRKFRLKTESVTEQKIELDIFSKPVHREISRMFYRLGFLEADFAKRLKGADLINNSDRSRIRELWSYRRTVETDAALIDASVYGGTVEEACTVLSIRKLRDVQKCSEASKLYVECFLMGINTADGFTSRMDDIIVSDGDFFSVGQGLYYFNMLYSLRRLYLSDTNDVEQFIRKCFCRAVTMIPGMADVNEDRADECIRISRLLYSLVSDGILSDEADMLTDAFIALTEHKDPEPSLYGAVSGLLYGRDSSYKNEIRSTVQKYLSGSGEIRKQGAAFLRGLFSTARDIVLIGDEFVRITDTLIKDFSMEDFLEVLPELRLAFSYFTPSETDRIAEIVSGLYDGSSGILLDAFDINKDVYPVGCILEKEIMEISEVNI